jgi:hypothetical protein
MKHVLPIIALLAGWVMPGLAGAAERKPNIVFILADDEA